jgi:hypothetical protein
MRTVLGDDEKILYKTRRHLLYLIGMLGVVCGITYVAILFFKIKMIFLGAIFFIWYFFMEWRNNIWVITNKRLIDEWGVFTKSLKETPLEKINNVSYKKDILGMIFNYGTIYVQSAAEDGTTIMKMMPNPEKFLQKISEAQNVFVSSTFMECPVCKEVIKRGAIKCRFCGTNLRQFYETNEINEINYDINYNKEKQEDISSGQKFQQEIKVVQQEIKVESSTDNTPFGCELTDSPSTVGNIYRRKVDFVDREGGNR